MKRFSMQSKKKLKNSNKEVCRVKYLEARLEKIKKNHPSYLKGFSPAVFL